MDKIKNVPYKDNKGKEIDEFGIKKIYGDKDNSYGWYVPGATGTVRVEASPARSSEHHEAAWFPRDCPIGPATVPDRLYLRRERQPSVWQSLHSSQPSEP